MYQAILSCFYNCNAQATVINFICFPVAIREFALSVFSRFTEKVKSVGLLLNWWVSANATSLRRDVKTIEEKNSGLLAVVIEVRRFIIYELFGLYGKHF